MAVGEDVATRTADPRATFYLVNIRWGKNQKRHLEDTYVDDVTYIFMFDFYRTTENGWHVFRLSVFLKFHINNKLSWISLYEISITSCISFDRSNPIRSDRIGSDRFLYFFFSTYNSLKKTKETKYRRIERSIDSSIKINSLRSWTRLREEGGERGEIFKTCLPEKKFVTYATLRDR